MVIKVKPVSFKDIKPVRNNIAGYRYKKVKELFKSYGLNLTKNYEVGGYGDRKYCCENVQFDSLKEAVEWLEIKKSVK